MGITLLAGFDSIDRVHEKVSSSTAYGTGYHCLCPQLLLLLLRNTGVARKIILHADMVAELPPPFPSFGHILSSFLCGLRYS